MNTRISITVLVSVSVAAGAVPSTGCASRTDARRAVVEDGEFELAHVILEGDQTAAEVEGVDMLVDRILESERFTPLGSRRILTRQIIESAHLETPADCPATVCTSERARVVARARARATRATRRQ